MFARLQFDYFSQVIINIKQFCNKILLQVVVEYNPVQNMPTRVIDCFAQNYRPMLGPFMIKIDRVSD